MLRAQQCNLCIDAGSAQKRYHQACFVFAVTESACEGLRYWIRLESINAELQSHIASAPQYQLVDRFNTIQPVGVLRNRVRGQSPEFGRKFELRTEEIRIPLAKGLP